MGDFMSYGTKKLFLLFSIIWSTAGWSFDGAKKVGREDYIGVFEISGVVSYCNIVSCNNIKMSLILHKRILGPTGVEVSDADVERVIACSPVALPIGQEYLVFLRYRNGIVQDFSRNKYQILSPESNCQFEMDLNSVYAKRNNVYYAIDSVGIVDIVVGKRFMEDGDLMSLLDKN